MSYQVDYAAEVVEALLEIQDYIIEHFKSEQSAQHTMQKLIKELRILQAMPESGFSADEKIGKVIDPPNKTYGTVLANGDYLAFYQIHDNKVFVTHLLSSRSDYLKLFEKI